MRCARAFEWCTLPPKMERPRHRNAFRPILYIASGHGAQAQTQLPVIWKDWTPPKRSDDRRGHICSLNVRTKWPEFLAVDDMAFSFIVCNCLPVRVVTKKWEKGWIKRAVSFGSVHLLYRIIEYSQLRCGMYGFKFIIRVWETPVQWFVVPRKMIVFSSRGKRWRILFFRLSLRRDFSLVRTIFTAALKPTDLWLTVFPPGWQTLTGAVQALVILRRHD